MQTVYALVPMQRWVPAADLLSVHLSSALRIAFRSCLLLMNLRHIWLVVMGHFDVIILFGFLNGVLTASDVAFFGINNPAVARIPGVSLSLLLEFYISLEHDVAKANEWEQDDAHDDSVLEHSRVSPWTFGQVLIVRQTQGEELRGSLALVHS